MLRPKALGDMLSEARGEDISTIILSGIDGTVLSYSADSDLPAVQEIASLAASIWGEYERAGRAALRAAGSLEQIVAAAEKGSLFVSPVAPSGSGDREATGEGFLLAALARSDAPLGRVRVTLDQVRKLLGPALSGLGALATSGGAASRAPYSVGDDDIDDN